VVVHCNGGKGRTGLTVVSCMLTLGTHTVRQAIKATRAARKGTITNPFQIAYAHLFAMRLCESAAEPPAVLLGSAAGSAVESKV
jgi:protein-tyrosine phosphatase